MEGGNTGAIAAGRLEAHDALWLLASLAGFFRRPFDAELALKHLSPPIDLPAILEALAAMGFRAGLAGWPQGGWEDVPLPVAVLLADRDAQGGGAASARQTPALVFRHGQDLVWVRPGQAQPEPFAPVRLVGDPASVLLLVSEAEPREPEAAASTFMATPLFGT